MLYQRQASNEAAVRMTWGNTVAAVRVPLNRMPFPDSEMPCNASDHHSKAEILSLGMAGAESTSCEIFSSNVKRETRSWTLWSRAKVVLQNGKDCASGLVESQEYGG